MRISYFIGCTVLITGASAGTGYEFARQLGPVVSTMVLVARRNDGLKNEKCRRANAQDSIRRRKFQSWHGSRMWREETGLSVKAAEYLQMYDRPRRGAITILFRVAVQRQAVRTRLPAEEMADLGFFDRSPGNATPSAKFFCQAKVNALT
jgi:NAD(P)-dependent dehydrogenase (short-subunit alcohol dehydrogenase family)